jgi:hypothetical protein
MDSLTGRMLSDYSNGPGLAPTPKDQVQSAVAAGGRFPRRSGNWSE